MRKYIVLLLFLVCGCTDKNKNSDLNKTGDGINIPLTEEVNDILKSLVQRYSTVSRVMMQREPDKTLTGLEKFKIEVCPYYEFDVQEFYSSSSPAKILECLLQPKNKICLFGERTDGSTFLLMTIKEDSVWKMETMTEDWRKVVSWLPDKLLKANTNEYKMFTLYAMSYFLFYREGQPVYCDLTGKEYTPEKVCEEFVNEVNRMKLYQKKIEEMRSKMNVGVGVSLTNSKNYKSKE